MVPKCALACTCKLTWIIRYTLIIGTLIIISIVSIIHRLYYMYSSQQCLEHLTELMRKPSLIKALSSKQHSFMYNSKQNIMHDCTWMLCITWMICGGWPLYKYTICYSYITSRSRISLLLTLDLGLCDITGLCPTAIDYKQIIRDFCLSYCFCSKLIF